MKWVTWEHVGIDRMACAWLIQRYLDTKAEFLFVPVGSLPLPDGAEPFDIPNTRLSHHQGHSTFFIMLQLYHLHDPVLKRIARLVDEADTLQDVTIEPAAPGLDLICQGIRTISPIDHIALERSALIYDALYAQLSLEPTSTQTM